VLHNYNYGINQRLKVITNNKHTEERAELYWENDIEAD